MIRVAVAVLLGMAIGGAAGLFLADLRPRRGLSTGGLFWS